MNLKQKGFTIVELLIVIVVIAVLATVSIVAFRGIQERARDSQRMSDIAAINKAIKLFIVDNGHAPYLTATNYCRVEIGPDTCFTNDFGSSGYGNWSYLNTELSSYLNGKPLPRDPCGLACYQKRNADASTSYPSGGGYFTYRYNAPGYFDPSVPINGQLPTNSSYTIGAQNLESRSAQYNFGFGSF